MNRATKRGLDRRRQWLHIVVLLTPWVLGLAMEATKETATLAGVAGPVCPSRLVTESGCPGCGLTRAVVLTLDGDISGALSVNLAGPCVLVLCLLGLLVRSDILLRGRMTDLHLRLLRSGHLVFASVVLVGWLIRLFA